MTELLFHGAAGEVTGSMHMIRVNDQWVALDCGLFQGHREDAERKNRRWPVPPAEIRAVILSHAHIDHTGRLPKLVKDGFDGPIHCTPATRDLCAVMLPDSAHIQMEDVEYVNKKRERRNLPPIEPLYDTDDALAAVRLMQTVPLGRKFTVLPGLTAMFVEAGHMLGSAGIRLDFGKTPNDIDSVYFTGDVGRVNHPIIRDPADFSPADVLICESTYGGRINGENGDARELLTAAVRRAFDRGGKVIIPAFSVGRSQSVVYFLQESMLRGQLPRYPVYVDSPLAVDATEVFKMHPDLYDADARKLDAATGDLLGTSCCTYIRDVQDSKALHRRNKPCVIISASGMCEAGRVRHHIKNNISEPRNMMIFVGYQAANTLGRRIVDGVKTINLFHEEYEVRAEVVKIEGLSGHADQADLLRMMHPLRHTAKRVYLVHGEIEQSDALARKLSERGFPRVEIAERGMRTAL